MSSRHQRLLFWCLVGCIVAMGLLLFSQRERSRGRVERLADDTLLDAPYTDTEPVTLDLADDSDGTVAAATRQIALPAEVTARARALLDHLIAEYALPGSNHPLAPGTAINEVFLVSLPIGGYQLDPNAPPDANGERTATRLVPNTEPNALQPHSPGGELAVVDLRGSFINGHPAGVEAESLTLLSIIGTLHANLPQIEQVRFLVDGQPRETLAGNADLLRTYPVRDTTVPIRAPVAP